MSNMVRRTLRLKAEINKKIADKAQELGISFNSYVSIILAKECNEK